MIPGWSCYPLPASPLSLGMVTLISLFLLGTFEGRGMSSSPLTSHCLCTHFWHAPRCQVTTVEKATAFMRNVSGSFSLCVCSLPFEKHGGKSCKCFLGKVLMFAAMVILDIFGFTLGLYASSWLWCRSLDLPKKPKLDFCCCCWVWYAEKKHSLCRLTGVSRVFIEKSISCFCYQIHK